MTYTARTCRRMVILVILLALLLIACVPSAAAAVPSRERSRVHANRQKMLRYVQRVNMVLERLVQPADDAAATPPTAETVALPAWVRAPQQWFKQSTDTIAKATTELSTLLRVMVGGSLSDDDEELLAQRQRVLVGARASQAATTPLKRRAPAESVHADAPRTTVGAPRSRTASPLADGDDSGDASSTDIRLLPNGCASHGLVVLSEGALVRCVDADGSEMFMTALQYSVSRTYSDECYAVTKTPLECLCQPEDYLDIDLPLFYRCTPRTFSLTPLLPERYLCYDEAAAKVGLPATRLDEYCLSATRTARIELNVSWATTMSDGRSDTSVSAESLDETYVVIGTEITGTINEIRKKVFEYDANDPAARQTLALRLLGERMTFIQVYSFSSPAASQQWSANIDNDTIKELVTTDGSPAVRTEYIDLSQVGDEAVEGGQFYAEIGLTDSNAVGSWVSRLHIRLSDMEEPPRTYHYSKPLGVLYIALIVLVCLIVVIVVLVVLWCYCTREMPEEEDQFSRAVRRRELQKQTSVKKKE